MEGCNGVETLTFGIDIPRGIDQTLWPLIEQERRREKQRREKDYGGVPLYEPMYYPDDPFAPDTDPQNNKRGDWRT